MKSTNFFAPYSLDGKCNLKTTGKGCYIIKKNDSVIYVGLSYSDVKRTLYRHFQKWTDLRTDYTKKNQVYERVTYTGQNKSNFKIKVIFCKTDKEISELEYLLIKKLKPKDNTLKNEIYSVVDLRKTIDAFNNSDNWKPTSEEPPF
jgi:excinuclease UvrABC nuclease subunit